MNEFMEQFVLESRELVEQATHDLLVLEKSPDDRASLDSAFRAFHTLKGGAGIIGFPAMERAIHAAEDVLSSVRSGSRRITVRLVGDCLAALDQVVQWMDAIEAADALPADADGAAGAIVARFGVPEAGAEPAPDPSSPPSGWAQALLARHEDIRPLARTAVHFVPEPDCFFSGEDPVARMSALPGLLALDLDPGEPWPSLDLLDPFRCRLVISALTRGAPGEAAAATAGALGRCRVEELGSSGTVGKVDLSSAAQEVLRAQVALLAVAGEKGAAGRVASAALVAANVLRHAGRTAAAEALMQVNARDPLLVAIRDALAQVAVAPADGISIAPAPTVTRHEVVRTLRVDAARVDALVNLAGELAVLTNAIGRMAKLAQDSHDRLAAELKGRHDALERLRDEFQRSVLALRVLPLRHVFQRFPRLVREISASLGRSASLVLEGEDTEADKVIVEMLFEPLLHVVRNAIDHGIEPAGERSSAGKSAVATVTMRARRQGEHVVVEVADDGRGMDVERIRLVAERRGMATEAALAGLSDEEIVDLVFAPGFSTASDVTGLSGRGVGMDAVRTAVARVGGQVVAESRRGQGTTVRFTLPFSIMMTRIVAVEAGGQMFGIPLDAVVESVRLPAERIVPVGAAQAIVLRDRTIPLLSLAGALCMNAEDSAGDDATVLVVRIGGQLGAVRVDRLGERMDAVLKPLDGLLAGMSGIAGSTLLGDGSVLLVLDLGQLIQ